MPKRNVYTALTIVVILGLLAAAYQYEQSTSLEGVENYLQFQIPATATKVDYGRSYLYGGGAFISFTVLADTYATIEADLDAICPATPLFINPFDSRERRDIAYSRFAFTSERCLKNHREYWVSIDLVANRYYIVGVGMIGQT